MSLCQGRDNRSSLSPDCWDNVISSWIVYGQRISERSDSQIDIGFIVCSCKYFVWILHLILIDRKTLY